jgi:hypothetical protein
MSFRVEKDDNLDYLFANNIVGTVPGAPQMVPTLETISTGGILTLGKLEALP